MLKQFQAFETSTNCSWFFYIKDDQFFLDIKQDNQPTTRCLSQDLLENHRDKKSSVKSFSLSRNLLNNSLSIALVLNVAEDQKDYLYFLTGLPLVPAADWCTPENHRDWIDRTSSSNTLEIEYVFLAEDKHTQSPVLLAGVKNKISTYIDNYLVNTSKEVTQNLWQAFYTAENYDTLLALQFGKPTNAMFSGFYTLTSLNGNLSLLFTPLKSAFGGPPNVLELTPPIGALDLSIYLTEKENTDLYVLTASGVKVYPAKTQINFASPTPFLMPKAGSLFTDFQIMNNVSFFALGKEDNQVYPTLMYLNKAFCGLGLVFSLVLSQRILEGGDPIPKKNLEDPDYQIFKFDATKLILSVEDSLEVGEGTDLGADFSNQEIMIFTEDLILSKKIEAQSVVISAYSITFTSETDTEVPELPNGSNMLVLETSEDLKLKEKKILDVFDFSHRKSITLRATSLENNLLKLDETTSSGDKVDFNSFLFAHPLQCTMLLQKAQRFYYVADPIKNKPSLDQAILYLNRLRDRTQFFKDLKEDSSLTKLYRDNEKSIGAINSINTLKNLYTQADALLGQISKGSDSYGNNYNYVPLAAFSFYQEILDKQLDLFTTIEKSYSVLLNKETTVAEKKQALKNSRSSLNGLISETTTQIDDLKTRLNDTQKQIDLFQGQFKVKRDALKDQIERFKNSLELSLYDDLDLMLSAIPTLLFLPETPAAWLVVGGQLAYDIKKSVESVENDEGVVINKDYLVQECKSFEGELSSGALDEQSKKLSTGLLELDDPGATKLLVEQKKLDDFVNSFSARFPAETTALEAAFADYVNLVLTRNSKILYYNALTTLIIQKYTLRKDSQEKIVSLNDQNLDDYQPNFPAFTSLLTSLYSFAQNQVLESLYLTERAFRFWSLNDDKPVANLFAGKQLTEIDSLVLKSGQLAILASYARAVENYGSDAQIFPKNDEKGKGIIWNLRQRDIDTLKTTFLNPNQHTVLFTIPPATLTSSIQENPFASLANVRLRKVRVWLEGAVTSNDEIILTLTHGGQETLCNQADEKFIFQHNPKKVRFSYNLKTQEILQDGDIGFGDNENTNGNSEKYALVGPFTWWTLTIKKSDNLDLDLSKLTKVSLDFYGQNYSF